MTEDAGHLRTPATAGAADKTDRIKALLESGDPVTALRLAVAEIRGGRTGPEWFILAANAWVAAVDEGSLLKSCLADELDEIHRVIILQEQCEASPPVLHHRIAAQHSGGVSGHLARAARILQPTLGALLRAPNPEPNAVLMALLLRSALGGCDQQHLSDLHSKYFAKFPVDHLRIPYNVIFDNLHFRQNVADLRFFVRTNRNSILSGVVPLTHLLLLYWLVEDAFELLPSDWAQRAIDARRNSQVLATQEEDALRSLALRFSITGITEQDAGLALASDSLSSTRGILAAEANGSDPAAIARIEKRPRQLTMAAFNFASAGFPLLARLRRRPRIALCVAGQLRGFRKAWKTWRPLLSGVDATVFVHSWTRVGHGTPEPFRYVLPFEGDAFCATYKSLGVELGLDNLRARYPNLFAALDHSGIVDEAEVGDVYGTAYVKLDDETQPDFASLSNPEKMYLKIQRCFDMAEASGDTFDLIVRIRPDKPIVAAAFDWADMIAALRERPALYCDTGMGAHFGAILMGDQLAIGLPEASRVYAETARRAPMLGQLSLYRMEPHLWGHTSVAQLCWLSGIQVRKAPIRSGPFCEAERLSAESICRALSEDCANRMDVMDIQLIRANQTDLIG